MGQDVKTTLLEAILARTGAIPKAGSVDAGTSIGDASPEARHHKMSVGLTAATTTFMGDSYTFIDCPGSVEFAHDLLINDGNDALRPATLRGLSPDAVLVLVDGKRYHTTSLVNYNSAIGRGSAPVDLNSIPIAAIDHIEVLRDGAAAQYGSDAIAGVVNVITKSNVEGFEFETNQAARRCSGSPTRGSWRRAG